MACFPLLARTGQAPYGGGGPPPGMEPVFKFRSDHAYATPAEMGAKARQRHELQEALERQVGGQVGRYAFFYPR